MSLGAVPIACFCKLSTLLTMNDRATPPDTLLVRGHQRVVQTLRKWSAAALSIARQGRPAADAFDGRVGPDRLRVSPSELLMGLAESSPDAVVLCDARGLIQAVNPAGVRLFGLPLQAMLQRPLAGMLPSFTSEGRAARQVADADLACHSDGRLVAVRVTVAQLACGDQLDCVHLHEVNPPARRTLPGPARPTDSADALVRLVAQTQRLQEMAADTTDSLGRLDLAHIDPTNLELLRLLKQQVQVMAGFASNLAELAMLDTPGQVLDEAPFDVKQLLSPLLSGFAARASEHDLALDLCWNLPSRMVMGDADRVTDLLRHLFQAVVADVRSGSLQIQIGARVTGSIHAGGELTVAVEADCGAYEAGRLLDRHRRLIAAERGLPDSGTHQEMGLYLAHRLALRMGGALSVSERLGGGVSLRACLGAGLFLGGEPLVQRVHLAGRSSVQSDGLRVLVVDDNRVNQRLLERWLQRDGMHVHCVADGLSAVRAVRDQAFDVILMDVSMPEMNGLEATTAIRALGLLPVQPVLHALRVPIIGVSAHAMAGDREACIAAGMDDYVTKPIQRDILLTKIANYVA